MFERFDNSDVNSAYEKFAVYCTQLGFQKKRKSLFVRQAADDIRHAIVLDHYIRYGELHVTIALCVFYDGIRTIVNEGMLRHSAYKPSKKEAPLIDALDISIPKFIIAHKKGEGATSDYTVSHPEEIRGVMEGMFHDTNQVIYEYFSQQETLPKLIAHFQNTPLAGGTAHWVKLMAMLLYVDRVSELRNLVTTLERAEIAPITEWMIAYTRKKLPEEPRQS